MDSSPSPFRILLQRRVKKILCHSFWVGRKKKKRVPMPVLVRKKGEEIWDTSPRLSLFTLLHRQRPCHQSWVISVSPRANFQFPFQTQEEHLQKLNLRLAPRTGSRHATDQLRWFSKVSQVLKWSKSESSFRSLFHLPFKHRWLRALRIRADKMVNWAINSRRRGDSAVQGEKYEKKPLYSL